MSLSTTPEPDTHLSPRRRGEPRGGIAIRSQSLEDRVSAFRKFARSYEKPSPIPEKPKRGRPRGLAYELCRAFLKEHPYWVHSQFRAFLKALVVEHFYRERTTLCGRISFGMVHDGEYEGYTIPVRERSRSEYDSQRRWCFFSDPLPRTWPRFDKCRGKWVGSIWVRRGVEPRQEVSAEALRRRWYDARSDAGVMTIHPTRRMPPASEIRSWVHAVVQERPDVKTFPGLLAIINEAGDAQQPLGGRKLISDLRFRVAAGRPNYGGQLIWHDSEPITPKAVEHAWVCVKKGRCDADGRLRAAT